MILNNLCTQTSQILRQPCAMLMKFLQRYYIFESLQNFSDWKWFQKYEIMAKTFKTSGWKARKRLTSCMECTTMEAKRGRIKGVWERRKKCQLTDMAHDMSNKDTWKWRKKKCCFTVKYGIGQVEKSSRKQKFKMWQTCLSPNRLAFRAEWGDD